jgi:hypothetical protein
MPKICGAHKTEVLFISLMDYPEILFRPQEILACFQDWKTFCTEVLHLYFSLSAKSKDPEDTWRNDWSYSWDPTKHADLTLEASWNNYLERLQEHGLYTDHMEDVKSIQDHSSTNDESFSTGNDNDTNSASSIEHENSSSTDDANSSSTDDANSSSATENESSLLVYTAVLEDSSFLPDLVEENLFHDLF